MILDSITIYNFKNIIEAELRFSPKINCFLGNNGMGKTNYLDSIYYLSFCKSHSNSVDSFNINYNADFFSIHGRYNVEGKNEEILCSLKNKRKSFKRNKKEYERLSDHIGLIPAVIVSPNDNSLIAEGSDERRKFVDSVISQYNKNYLSQLISYNNALKQRNALLKTENKVEDALFEIWEEQMELYGNQIYITRVDFLNSFIPIFQDYYSRISNGKEKIELQYQSQHKNNNIKDKLTETRQRDKILGYSTIGVHKDDLEMMLDGYPIKRVGSQGQNKTYLISLKMAEYDFLKNITQSTPILLLDDIFDKLDTERVHRIVEIVASPSFGQIFITDTNKENLNLILEKFSENYLIFEIENGKQRN